MKKLFIVILFSLTFFLFILGCDNATISKLIDSDSLSMNQTQEGFNTVLFLKNLQADLVNTTLYLDIYDDTDSANPSLLNGFQIALSDSAINSGITFQLSGKRKLEGKIVDNTNPSTVKYKGSISLNIDQNITTINLTMYQVQEPLDPSQFINVYPVIKSIAFTSSIAPDGVSLVRRAAVDAYDPKGGTLTYIYKLVDSAGAVLTQKTSAIPSYDFIISQAGTYGLVVTASNASRSTVYQSMQSFQDLMSTIVLAPVLTILSPAQFLSYSASTTIEVQFSIIDNGVDLCAYIKTPEGSSTIIKVDFYDPITNEMTAKYLDPNCRTIFTAPSSFSTYTANFVYTNSKGSYSIAKYNFSVK